MDTLKTYSINKQDKSPFYFVSWRGKNGQQFKRSTKVPHAGGMFQGRKITVAQAARLAEQVAVRLMAEQEEKSKDERNISVRRVFDFMISWTTNLSIGILAIAARVARVPYSSNGI